MDEYYVDRRTGEISLERPGRRAWRAVGLVLLGIVWAAGELNESRPAVGAVMRAAGFEAVGGSDELDGPFGVVRVIDGDTVDVDVGGESVRVRLLNVDTPERGERGFGEAAEALAELAGEDVYLRYDQGGEPTEDAYGRVLAYLYDDQGGNLNEELVREGWSEYYTDYGDGDFPEGFADAEGEAREEGLGLWSGEP